MDQFSCTRINEKVLHIKYGGYNVLVDNNSGYVNATTLCMYSSTIAEDSNSVHDKRDTLYSNHTTLSDWIETDAAKTVISHISEATGLPNNELFISYDDSNCESWGTYVHRSIAYCIANSYSYLSLLLLLGALDAFEQYGILNDEEEEEDSVSSTQEEEIDISRYTQAAIEFLEGEEHEQEEQEEEKNISKYIKLACASNIDHMIDKMNKINKDMIESCKVIQNSFIDACQVKIREQQAVSIEKLVYDRDTVSVTDSVIPLEDVIQWANSQFGGHIYDQGHFGTFIKNVHKTSRIVHHIRVSCKYIHPEDHGSCAGERNEQWIYLWTVVGDMYCIKVRLRTPHDVNNSIRHYKYSVPSPQYRADIHLTPMMVSIIKTITNDYSSTDPQKYIKYYTSIIHLTPIIVSVIKIITDDYLCTDPQKYIKYYASIIQAFRKHAIYDSSIDSSVKLNRALDTNTDLTTELIKVKDQLIKSEERYNNLSQKLSGAEKLLDAISLVQGITELKNAINE